MRTLMFRTAMASATLVCLLAGSTAWAQNKEKPAVGGAVPKDDKLIKQPVDNRKGGDLLTMVITNGETRTFHYFTDKGRMEQDALTKLEVAQNQMNLAKQLMALREKYVQDELNPQPRQSFYSTSLMTDAFMAGSVPVFYGNPPIAQFLLPNMPFYWSYPVALGAGTFTGVQTVQTVAPSTGEDSKLRAEMAKTLAKQATPEYLAKATEDYHQALAAVDQIPEFRAALGLPNSGIRQAVGPETKPSTKPSPMPPAK